MSEKETAPRDTNNPAFSSFIHLLFVSRPFRPPSISAASRLVTLTLQPLLLSHEIDGVRKEKERLTAIISLTPFPLLGLLPSYAVHSSLIHGRSERQTRRPEGEGVRGPFIRPHPGPRGPSLHSFILLSLRSAP